MKKKTLFWRKLNDRFHTLFSAASVFIAVTGMILVLYTVVIRGMDAVSLDFFLNSSRPYGVEGGGIANAILGSVMITVFAAVLAIPPAVLAGIFLSEYPDAGRAVAVLRFAANVMMGVPSVLVGLFVYVIIVVPSGHFSGFAASVSLAVIMFPLIMRTTEDMLGMVPNSLRESSLALGMTKMRSVLCIVCRSARNGLLTGILLAVARVSGETAPLLFTAMFADAWPSDFFTGPTANMPVLITEYTTNSPFAEMHTAGWGASLVITAAVLAVNIVTRIVFREKNNAG